MGRTQRKRLHLARRSQGIIILHGSNVIICFPARRGRFGLRRHRQLQSVSIETVYAPGDFRTQPLASASMDSLPPGLRRTMSSFGIELLPGSVFGFFAT